MQVIIQSPLCTFKGSDCSQLIDYHGNSVLRILLTIYSVLLVHQLNLFLANLLTSCPVSSANKIDLLNLFTSGILYFFWSPVRDYFLAIKNLSVNETMSGQPNKCLIH